VTSLLDPSRHSRPLARLPRGPRPLARLGRGPRLLGRLPRRSRPHHCSHVGLGRPEPANVRMLLLVLLKQQ
jgi:hypothetical protein